MSPEIHPLLPVALALLFVLAAALAALHYTSEATQIRMDDLEESTGRKPDRREVRGPGRIRAAWRMFVIDLILVPAVLAGCLLGLALAALPLLAWTTASAPLRIAGTSLSVCILLAGAMAVLTGIPATGLVTVFARRACVLDDMGVHEALQRGVDLVKSHPAESILMGLALFGIGLLWTVILVPVVLVLAVLGMLLAWFPALIAGLAAGNVGGENAALIAAAAVGLPIFLLVILVPALLLDGWLEPLFSSSWTRFYRDATGRKTTAG